MPLWHDIRWLVWTTMAGGGFSTPQESCHLKTCNIVPPRRKVGKFCGMLFFLIWSNALFQVFQVFHTQHRKYPPKKYQNWFLLYLYKLDLCLKIIRFGQPSSWDSHLILGLLVMMAPSKPFLTCHRALGNALGITNGSGKFIPNTELMYGLFAYIWVV